MSIGIHIGLASQGSQFKNSVIALLATTALEHYSEQENPSSSGFYMRFGVSGHDCLGRAALDHNSATQFAKLGRIADATLGSEGAALARLARLDCVYVVLPVRMPTCLEAESCYVVSSAALVATMLLVAPSIGIGITGQDISDSQAEAINEGEGDATYIELQTVWLTLYEAARLSLLNKTAVVLA